MSTPRPGRRAGVRRYQRYGQMTLPIGVKTLEAKLGASGQGQICGDGVSAQCQLPLGHKGRHKHFSDGLIMSWKNIR